MTAKNNYHAFLRQVQTTVGSPPTEYTVSTEEATIIGREPSCQIVLDSSQYEGVSRRHLEIRPLASPGMPVWQVYDLNSSNGTYINGKLLQGCHTMQHGDRLALGRSGVEFIFECQQPNTSSVPISSNDNVSLTQLIPIMSTRGDIRWKKLMIPGAFTVFCVVLMFNFIGQPIPFMGMFALFLAVGGFYVVYQLCGKEKPWWVLLASCIVTIVILITPLVHIFFFIFREILPGGIKETNFITTFIHHLFGAGLMEELLKAVPIFLALFIGQKVKSPLREKVGVWEPLDGILLGAASAVGFTLVETLLLYVPKIINQAASQHGESLGFLVGLQLLIPRILGSIAGHMAYSGYFGYFIGLSILKPSKRWEILGIGYVTSSVIHALWNSVGSLSDSPFVGTILQCVAGLLGFGFLVAAIIKARQISPSRAQNFATRFGDHNSY